MKITVKNLISAVQLLEETVAEAEKTRTQVRMPGVIQALDEFIKKGSILLENILNEETYSYVEDIVEFTKTSITREEVVADGKI